MRSTLLVLLIACGGDAPTDGVPPGDTAPEVVCNDASSNGALYALCDPDDGSDPCRAGTNCLGGHCSKACTDAAECGPDRQEDLEGCAAEPACVAGFCRLSCTTRFDCPEPMACLDDPQVCS